MILAEKMRNIEKYVNQKIEEIQTMLSTNEIYYTDRCRCESLLNQLFEIKDVLEEN